MVKLLLVCLAVCVGVSVVEAIPAGSTNTGGTLNKTTLTPGNVAFEKFELKSLFYFAVNKAVANGGLLGSRIEVYNLVGKELKSTYTEFREAGVNERTVTYEADRNDVIAKYKGFPNETSTGIVTNYLCGYNCLLTLLIGDPEQGQTSVSNYWTVTCPVTKVPKEEIEKCKALAKDATIEWFDLNPSVNCGCASKTP